MSNVQNVPDLPNAVPHDAKQQAQSEAGSRAQTEAQSETQAEAQASPQAAAQPRRAAARLSDWMRSRSWAIAMTVAIVITVGGLVILETARERIAAEYETALEARDVTVQLSALASQLSRLSAQQSDYLLTKRDDAAHAFCATAARIRASEEPLERFYRSPKADSAELASFTQIRALIDARIGAGAAALQRAAPHPLELGACGSTSSEQAVDPAFVDSTLSLLRDNEERRAQHALAASRADQRISTLCAAGLSALNIVLFILLFRNLGIQIDRQARVQRQLITQQGELDQLVNERTRQLEALGWHLQAVSENEKTQLARELHDELGAILTASKMDVAWANRKLKDSAPEIAGKLQRALANLDQGIALKRRIIEDMRPTVLANFGLVTALRTLADEAASAQQLDIEPAASRRRYQARRANRNRALSRRAGIADERGEIRARVAGVDRSAYRRGASDARHCGQRRGHHACGFEAHAHAWTARHASARRRAWRTIRHTARRAERHRHSCRDAEREHGRATGQRRGRKLRRAAERLKTSL
ncbi:signal transduction histidine kinase [Burkholderia sp. OAS925]